MTKKSNHTYQVVGNLMSEKSSENYPSMVLCDDCVDSYEVVVNEGPSSEPCEDCGEPDEDDE